MNFNFLQDSFGNNSSKRLAAFFILVPTIIVATIIECVAINHTIAHPDIIKTLIDGSLFAATSLLVAGVAENFTYKKSDDNAK